MKRRTTAVAVVAAACMTFLNGTGVAAAVTPAAAAATRVARGDPSGDGWGKAAPIPGLATLNTGGTADLNAISCPSAGNCGAGGNYFGSSSQQAFVVGEGGGTWGKAERVRGLAAFHQPGKFFAASVIAVSCASPGNCAAGGFYYVTAHDQQGFLVTETDGRWGSAQQVPGLQKLNNGRYAEITDVSCPSPGNCSAGGFYSTPVGITDFSEAFVVNQTHGTWGKAEEVPGTATLNVANAMVDSLSCRSAGNCSAGGSYGNTISTAQAFVVSEVNGTWGTAEEVPGTATLNVGGQASVNSVSCGSPGNCAAGGDYEGRTGKYLGSQAFVVSEVNGRWGTAEEVPGTVALNRGHHAQVASVSCPSAGNCAAGGQYYSLPGQQQVFVVNQVHGRWRTAEEIPGSAALNRASSGFVSQVSCASPGNCAAGGSYAATSIIYQAFVVTEVNGTWQAAERVPGSGTLNNAGFAATFALSCPAPGDCAAGGYYTYQATTQTHNQSAFIVDQTRT